MKVFKTIFTCIVSLLVLTSVYILIAPPVMTDSTPGGLGVQNNLRQLSASLNLYNHYLQRYPNNDEGLELLLEPYHSQKRTIVFLSEIPKDIWGNYYGYLPPKNPQKGDFAVYSFGANMLNEYCKGDDICVTNK